MALLLTVKCILTESFLFVCLDKSVLAALALTTGQILVKWIRWSTSLHPLNTLNTTEGLDLLTDLFSLKTSSNLLITEEIYKGCKKVF